MKLAITVLENGNLEFAIVQSNKEDRKEWLALYDEYRKEQICFDDENTFGHMMQEAGLYFLPDDEYETIGALTEAPIITDYDWWNDDDITPLSIANSKVWYYPYYQIKNAFEELVNNRKVEFTVTE